MLFMVLVRHRVRPDWVLHETHDLIPQDVNADLWESHCKSILQSDRYLSQVMVVAQNVEERVLTFDQDPTTAREELTRCWTNAPVAYDYGYVFQTGKTEQGFREVVMPREHYAYQVGRYGSGMYSALQEGTKEFEYQFGFARFPSLVA